MVGGHADLGGVVNGLVRTRANLAFVALGGVEDGEERLAGAAVLVVGLAAGLVPDLAGFGEVVVLLGVVRAVVAGLAEELRIHLEAAGQRHHGAHVLGTGGRRIQAADQRGAGGRADGGTRPGEAVAQATRGEGVHVRRSCVFVAIAAHLRTMVLAGNPEDVRPVGSGGAEGGELPAESPEGDEHQSVRHATKDANAAAKVTSAEAARGWPQADGYRDGCPETGRRPSCAVAAR